jgi:hypothetical protein
MLHHCNFTVFSVVIETKITCAAKNNSCILLRLRVTMFSLQQHYSNLLKRRKFIYHKINTIVLTPFSLVSKYWLNVSHTIWRSNIYSNNTIRNFDTLSKFTSELKKINETEKHAVPKHYFMVLKKKDRRTNNDLQNTTHKT